jgi:hypothetical protein
MKFLRAYIVIKLARKLSIFEKRKSSFLYLKKTPRNMEGGWWIGLFWHRIEISG